MVINFQDLPAEIVWKILGYLDTKSLCRIMITCKLCYYLVPRKTYERKKRNWLRKRKYRFNKHPKTPKDLRRRGKFDVNIAHFPCGYTYNNKSKRVYQTPQNHRQHSAYYSMTH